MKHRINGSDCRGQLHKASEERHLRSVAVTENQTLIEVYVSKKRHIFKVVLESQYKKNFLQLSTRPV